MQVELKAFGKGKSTIGIGQAVGSLRVKAETKGQAESLKWFAKLASNSELYVLVTRLTQAIIENRVSAEDKKTLCEVVDRIVNTKDFVDGVEPK